MKTYTFPYFADFGGGDYGDAEADIELTDEEAKRLEESAKEFAPVSSLEDAPEDIYDKVMEAILEGEEYYIRETPSIAQDYLWGIWDSSEYEEDKWELTFSDDKKKESVFAYLNAIAFLKNDEELKPQISPEGKLLVSEDATGWIDELGIDDDYECEEVCIRKEGYMDALIEAYFDMVSFKAFFPKELQDLEPDEDEEDEEE